MDPFSKLKTRTDLSSIFLLQVVDRPWPFNGGLVALNSFGFGGANAHVLLRSNPKPKEGPIQDNIPRLVAVSGRTADAVNFMLDKVK